MARFALLIRGINVGKDNGLPMKELTNMLTRLGCTSVRTYLQSGNAVLDTRLSARALASAVESELGRFMGREVPVTLRTKEELTAVITANPLAAIASNPSYHCVTFLSVKPKPAQLALLSARDFAPERWVLAGREIHSWHPNGQGRSALSSAIAKLKLEGAVTTRNWKTVQALAELLG